MNCLSILIHALKATVECKHANALEQTPKDRKRAQELVKLQGPQAFHIAEQISADSGGDSQNYVQNKNHCSCTTCTNFTYANPTYIQVGFYEYNYWCL